MSPDHVSRYVKLHLRPRDLVLASCRMHDRKESPEIALCQRDQSLSSWRSNAKRGSRSGEGHVLVQQCIIQDIVNGYLSDIQSEAERFQLDQRKRSNRHTRCFLSLNHAQPFRISVSCPSSSSLPSHHTSLLTLPRQPSLLQAANQYYPRILPI